MNKALAGLLFLLSTMLCAADGLAQNVNVRGTLTAFDGRVVAVKTRDGRELRLELPDTVTVSVTRPFSFGELKPGQVVAATTIRRASDGATVAIDLRPIPATANQGLSPYDLQPESTMTNATLEGVVAAASGHEITLNYRTGTVKVLVPEGTPMSRSAPGERADLKPGETVFAVARRGPEDRLTVIRIQVSKDGVKPTQ